MSITRRFRRSAQLCAIACALLVPATAAYAAADPLAQERQYMSQPADPTQQAVGQERYYSSYGDPEPLTAPRSPASEDGTPWLPIALSAALALALGAVGASRVRRLHVRRHAARTTG